MKNSFPTPVAILGFALVVALASLPAAGETYTITMTNGTTFQSRYDPIEAPWDDTKILFLNEYGTSMTLIKEDVDSVTAASESNGFGKVIDSTTVDLGILLVDVPPPDEKNPEEAQRDNFADYLDRTNAQYSVDQFVDPSQAGAGGLPAWGGSANF